MSNVIALGYMLAHCSGTTTDLQLFEAIRERMITAPYSEFGFIHRNKGFAPADLRGMKKHLYVLSDLPDFSDTELLAQCDGLRSSLDGMSDEEVRESAFYLVFSTDEVALKSVQRIIQCKGIFIPSLQMVKTSYSRVSSAVIGTLFESFFTIGKLFGGYQLHENLCQAIDMTKDVAGDFLEIGVFTGSSSFTSLMYMRNRNIPRKCWLMDTFEGFNYADATDSADAIWAGTHEVETEQHIDMLEQKLANTRQDFTIVRGNICKDPLPSEIKQLALVNLDLDLYEAILAALHKTAPFVSKNGVIICEDAAATPSLYGAFAAMEEFLESSEGKKFVKVFLRTQYFLIKTDA